MWGFSSLISRSTIRQPTDEITHADRDKEDGDKGDIIQTRSQEEDASETDSTQTTPKASATVAAASVPALSLDEPDPTDTNRTREETTESTVSALQKASSANSSAPNVSSLMPPPPQPVPRVPASKSPNPRPTASPARQLLAPPKLKTPAPLRPPPSAAANLRNPAGGLSTSTLAPAKRPSRKVILGPGYSPLDWASLSKDPRNNLRGSGLPPTLIKVTPSMLKAHNGRKGVDAWTSYNGKVYNITRYVPFHPGGKGELLRGAGKDSAKLFLETHPWVNWDGILGECLVGILVSENERAETNNLDAMD